jgi:predicted permease
MLHLFTDILTQITLPILAVAGLGYVMQRRMKFDVASFNRLIVYAVLPCFLVHYLSTATIPLSAVSFTAWFTVVQFVFLIALGWTVAVVLRVPADTRPVLGLAAAVSNSGNYAIPLVDLAFGKEYILHQAVIVSLHSVLITSLGVYLIAPRKDGWLAAFRSAMRTPIVPAVALGLLLRAFEVRLPALVSIPVQMVGSAYTPLALFALGAQLANGNRGMLHGALTLGIALRLLIAPAVTWAAVVILGVERGLADMLVVTAGTPAGVLLAIICNEYRANGELASAIVFFSTLLSPIFVTAVLLAMRLW